MESPFMRLSANIIAMLKLLLSERKRATLGIVALAEAALYQI
jgi:hypothetical protein